MLNGILALLVGFGGLQSLPSGGTDVFAKNAFETVPVGGLERTQSAQELVRGAGPDGGPALKVTIGADSLETNATQLTVPTAAAVKQGDRLLALISLRGKRASGGPAQAEVMFEKSTDPWTKSLTQAVFAPPSGWSQTVMAFESASDYGVGEAMLSVRLAFGKQTVEIGGLRVLNYGKSRSLDELMEVAAAASGAKSASILLKPGIELQTFSGMGGNFCQPRYGRTEAMDNVGRFVLANLNVKNARIGLPLNNWAPEPGKYVEEGQARASLEALKILDEKGIPTVVSVWEGAGWLLGGNPEQMGRELSRDKYEVCARAIGEYLKLAKTKYGVDVPYFSFNEADLGVNFKFGPSEIAAFIKVAAPIWRGMGVSTKFLVADTANGTATAAYATPLLEDPALRPHLGPIAFHSWDAFGASDEAYQKIAELGKKYGKEVWCTEAGHDAQLWQRPNPWAGWENALRTAFAYARAIRLTRASVVQYWTYQDNYPLVDNDSQVPYPVFHTMKQMETVLQPGWKVVETEGSSGTLQVLATKSPDGKQIGMLVVNLGGSSELTIRGFRQDMGAEVVTRDRGQAAVGISRRAVPANGFLKLTVPVRSVTTVVLRGS